MTPLYWSDMFQTLFVEQPSTSDVFLGKEYVPFIRQAFNITQDLLVFESYSERTLGVPWSIESFFIVSARSLFR